MAKSCKPMQMISGRTFDCGTMICVFLDKECLCSWQIFSPRHDSGVLFLSINQREFSGNFVV